MEKCVSNCEQLKKVSVFNQTTEMQITLVRLMQSQR